VAAEQHTIAVDPAVRLPLGDISAGDERFTQGRVERILWVAIGVGSSVLGMQGFLNALSSTQEDGRWRALLLAVVFVPLAAMVVALFTGIAVRPAAAVFAGVLPLALIAWPAVTAGRAAHADGEPWIWYLLNVGTVAAVVAFRLPVQIVWAALIPVLYGVGRVIQVGTAPTEVTLVALDTVYAMILAGVLIVLGWMLRTAAVGIDAARRDAVASYAAAAAADAAEKERVAVAALMHDSVLAALIAAERSTTDRERALAVAMAREALTRLANADQDSGEGSDEPVEPTAVARGLESAVHELGLSLTVDAAVASNATAIPGRVARALVLAATQAVANAVQHAAGSGLEAALAADAAGISIRVADAGEGFDASAVPADRLGIRGSIFARTAAVGGRVRIESGPAGTVVQLSWEHSP